jgi:hypothetical protein
MKPNPKHHAAKTVDHPPLEGVKTKSNKKLSRDEEKKKDGK